MAISAAGQCHLDDADIPCASIGPKIRDLYPTTNPQVFICSDLPLPSERVSAVWESLGDVRLFCTKMTCDVEDREPALTCKHLLQPNNAINPDGGHARAFGAHAFAAGYGGRWALR